MQMQTVVIAKVPIHRWEPLKLETTQTNRQAHQIAITQTIATTPEAEHPRRQARHRELFPGIPRPRQHQVPLLVPTPLIIHVRLRDRQQTNLLVLHHYSTPLTLA
jgi:hypothetical protein